MVKCCFKENRPVFSVFIDMQKAFDSVDRELMYYILLEYNLGGNFYNCLQSIYNNSRAFYADDIVIFSDSALKLTEILSVVGKWCLK